MEQVALLASGAQFWLKNVACCRAGGSATGGRSSAEEEEEGESARRMAFCSSLAVFVFDVDRKALTHVLAGYEGMLSAVAWSLYDAQLIATACQDGRMVLWDLRTEQRRAVVMLKQAPLCLAWFPVKNKQYNSEVVGPATVVVATSRGSVLMWNTRASTHRTLVHRNSAGSGKSKEEQKRLKTKFWPTVLRCNLHPVSGEIAVGFKDGRIELVSADKDKQDPISFYPPGEAGAKRSKQEQFAVSDMQWDPCSPNYLLTAYAGMSELLLWDCIESTPALLQRFPLSGKLSDVVGLAWQSWAPGNFMSISKKGAGVVNVWNVSQKEPIDLLQVSTASVNATAIETWGSLCVVPMEDGSVCAFEARRKGTLFQTNPGHRETVFDVQFHPEDAGIFASASFDGRVKIWDLAETKVVRTLKHKDKPIIYSTAWCPNGVESRSRGCLLATSTYTGVVSVWDINDCNGKLLHSSTCHKAPVYRVAWNPCDPSELASASADGTLVVHKVDLNTGKFAELVRFAGPGKLFGCAWAPSSSKSRAHGWVAAGCQTGSVIVWDVAKRRRLAELKGHKSKTFNVTWSTLRNGVVASGSDDNSIKIWNLGPLAEQESMTQGSTDRVIFASVTLDGHTSKVRALKWSPELPEILLSGSWDGTIRVWNVDKSAQLACVHDHHADVYGLDIHPDRPFNVLSSSRDTTIRVWEQRVPAVIRQAKISLVAEAIAEVPPAPRLAAPQQLHGTTGTRIYKAVLDASPASLAGTLEEIHACFGLHKGQSDFWKLLSKRGGTTLVHACEDLVERHAKRELNKARPGSTARESATRYVQELCKLGDFRTACEYLCQHHEWTQALALAPAVSLAYWERLVQNHAMYLSRPDTNHHDVHGAVAHFMAAGKPELAVRCLTDRGDYEQAMVVAQASASLNNKRPGMSHDGGQEAKESLALSGFEVRDRLTRLRCQQLLEEGQSVLAACCLLSIDDVSGAIDLLLMVDEPTLALSVAAVRTEDVSKHEELMLHLGFACEQLGSAPLALHFYRKSRNPTRQVHLFCGRLCIGNTMRQQLGLRLGEQYLRQAREAESKGEDLEKVLNLLCASGRDEGHTEALDLAVGALTMLLKKSDWDLPRMERIMDVVQAFDLVRMYGVERTDKHALVLAIAGFLGGLRAEALGYNSVVLPLFRTARGLMTEFPKMGFPVSLARVLFHECSFRVAQIENTISGSVAEVLANVTLARNLCKQALDWLERQEQQGEEDGALAEDFEGFERRLEAVCLKARGPQQDAQDSDARAVNLMGTLVCSRALPNGNIRLGKRSLFDGSFIKGPAVELLDVSSKPARMYLSKSQALLWHHVNRFSPMNTGGKLFPTFFSPAPSAKPTLGGAGRVPTSISKVPSSSSSSMSSTRKKIAAPEEGDVDQEPTARLESLYAKK